MLDAIERISMLAGKARTVRVPGNREYNPAWHTALDLKNLLCVAEGVARAGVERKESRGGHFREDYQEKSEVFGKTTLAIRRSEDGTMSVSHEAVEPMPDDLQQIIEENK